MKTKQWLLPALGVALGFAVVSGGASPLAAAETNQVAKAPPAKVFVPEPAVAKQNHVNVRGQAAVNSEIVTHLQKGQAVTVLEEITKKPGPDEPAKWFRIQLPTNTTVWVHADYIDATNKTVKPNRLNLRGGPGENYSVLGRIEKGATVTVITNKGTWLKIEAPAAASGFVAAHLLSKELPPAAVAVAPKPAIEIKPVVVPAEVKPGEPVVTNVVVVNVTNTPAAVMADTNVSVTTAVTKPPSTNLAVAAAAPPAPEATPPPAVTNLVAVTAAASESVTNELIKRVVTREGVLKGGTSIQAPSYFELRSLDNNRLINYVWSPSTNVTLKQFKGYKVLLTGEELLDERWPNTPVITIDSIDHAP
ncbi:MAG: SH3 domain-containing protein [Verrucomicrobia bacterium]|nr:SH3 domain-containing protein [Verrucomicrobiota bacterium]